jgi:ribosome-binding factor A
MKEFARTDRIGSEMQRELADLLREDVKDPRLGLITVQAVRVTRDLAHAKVFFTCFGTAEEARQREGLLNGKLAGFLRHELGTRMALRTVPELHFVYDESIEAGERLSALIDRAVESERSDPES